jgi:hypothetical protein
MSLVDRFPVCSNFWYLLVLRGSTFMESVRTFMTFINILNFKPIYLNSLILIYMSSTVSFILNVYFILSVCFILSVSAACSLQNYVFWILKKSNSKMPVWNEYVVYLLSGRDLSELYGSDLFELCGSGSLIVMI